MNRVQIFWWLTAVVFFILFVLCLQFVASVSGFAIVYAAFLAMALVPAIWFALLEGWRGR